MKFPPPLTDRKVTYTSDDGTIEVPVTICDEVPGADFSALLASQRAIEVERERRKHDGDGPVRE
jgi:hypothetical protein